MPYITSVDHHAAPHRRDPEAAAVAGPGRGRARRRSTSGPATSRSSLALLQSTGLVFLFHNRSQQRLLDIFPGDHVHAAEHRARRSSRSPPARRMIMWLGELITAARRRQRHVDPDLHQRDLAAAVRGQRDPAAGRHRQVRRDRAADRHRRSSSRSCFMDQGQRRIPIQYAKRVVGRRMTIGRQHVPAAQGQPGGRHPDHLRDVGPVLPDAAGERVSTRQWFQDFVNELRRTTRRAWSTWRCSRC